jgi:hypothetical protein
MNINANSLKVAAEGSSSDFVGTVSPAGLFSPAAGRQELPYCVVEFDTKGDAGHMRKWQGEFSNPGQLSRRGWSAASLKTGDKITIAGHPAKNSAPAMHVTRIRLADGRELNLALEDRG